MYAQVVAPVRETAAQALGAAVQPLPLSQAQALLSLLHQLIQQQQWDVRHGGLLGLKYLLAARKDASQELMSQALPAAILGLQVTLVTMTSACCIQIAAKQQVTWHKHRLLSTEWTFCCQRCRHRPC